MRHYLKVFLGLLFFIFLTILTQVGGIAFLISIPAFGFVDRKINRKWPRIFTKALSFLILYFLFVFVLVPIIASPFGRVPLPLFETNHVRPTNMLTVLLMRNYVRPPLRQAVYEVANQLNASYPGTRLNYLDASFPFIKNFPLPPHLSHNDGRKLDVSFLYMDAGTAQPTNEVPSWFGYGVCEEPRNGEFDRPAACAKKGYWQYSFLAHVASQKNKAKFPFDPVRTRSLVELFSAQSTIGALLLEPHLKRRLGITSSKVRLHGCNAVRHDDHLHIQLK